MENLKLDVLKINTYLELDREVSGIKFLFDKEEYDKFNGEELKSKMAYCTMVRNSMKGKAIKAKLENFACLSAAKAVGLLEVTDEDDSGKRRSEIGAYKNLCISRSISKDMIYCKHKIYGIGIMPLREYVEEPDVVIIVTNPFNAMRISQGYSYHNGQIKNAKFTGMQAVCQECTSYPFENNDINISLLCAGTRMLAQWKESEMGIGLPYHLFNEVVDGIEKTINPLERNKNKKIIEKKLLSSDIENVEIIFNKNYDDGSYKGI